DPPRGVCRMAPRLAKLAANCDGRLIVGPIRIAAPGGVLVTVVGWVDLGVRPVVVHGGHNMPMHAVRKQHPLTAVDRGAANGVEIENTVGGAGRSHGHLRASG